MISSVQLKRETGFKSIYDACSGNFGVSPTWYEYEDIAYYEHDLDVESYSLIEDFYIETHF